MDSEAGLALIRRQIETIRNELVEHPVYREIDRLPALRVFMQHHAFAVWDFMSLLKALQQKLTCVDVPWLPTGDRLGARLVNEIVLGEETDADGQGGFASHFELYLRSMRQCGASTATVDAFIKELRAGNRIDQAFERCAAPPAVAAFVQQTFAVISSGDLPTLAAVFTFGREDLLPDLFSQIVRELNAHSGGELQGFIYYLERHIALDGDEHGPLAQQLIASLCGEDSHKWEAAARAAQATLLARKSLWDAILQAIRELPR